MNYYATLCNTAVMILRLQCKKTVILQKSHLAHKVILL